MIANFPEAHCNLGLALRSRGELVEAVAELRKARDLAPKDSDFARRIGLTLAAVERQASLAAKLPAVLAGKIKPGNAAETLEFALICYHKGLQGASARFWAEAFQAEPKLADDMQAHHRYNAACAAALAGCGRSKDEPPLDDASRTRWRRQALEWLEADLAAWSRTMESGPPQSRQPLPHTLQDWKDDPDLAGLRDPSDAGQDPGGRTESLPRPLGSGRRVAGQDSSEPSAVTPVETTPVPRRRSSPGASPETYRAGTLSCIPADTLSQVDPTTAPSAAGVVNRGADHSGLTVKPSSRHRMMKLSGSEPSLMMRYPGGGCASR